MDAPAQHIPPLDTQAIGGLVGRVRLSVLRPEIETAVGPLHVVVGDVGPEDRSRCRRPSTTIQSRHSVRTVFTHRSAKAFARGARTGVRMTSDAVACEHRVEARGVL